jgi:nitrogen regulatory protein PII
MKEITAVIGRQASGTKYTEELESPSLTIQSVDGREGEEMHCALNGLEMPDSFYNRQTHNAVNLCLDHRCPRSLFVPKRLLTIMYLMMLTRWSSRSSSQPDGQKGDGKIFVAIEGCKGKTGNRR